VSRRLTEGTRLSGYKARIGQEAFCQLRASLPECVTLDLYLFEDWYDELDSLLTEATDKLHDMEDAAKNKLEQAKESLKTALMEKLNALIDDPAFRALKTQRAMYTYATVRIEGLSKLREVKVKQTIESMADKIGMKKHT